MGERAAVGTWQVTTAPGKVARSWSAPLEALVFTLSYFAAAQLKDWLSLGALHIAPFWLPVGLFMGVLLRVEPRRWPLFIAAAALVNIGFNVAEQGHPVSVALRFAAANVLEVVTGAGLLRLFWFRGRAAGFATLGDVLAVSIIAGVAAPFVWAAAGAGAMAAGLGTAYFKSWAIRWSIHAVGVLLVTPIVLVVPAPGQLRSLWHGTPFARRFEAAAMLATVVACSVFFFIVTPPGLHITALALPIVLWPALRGGPLGVAAAVIAMALIATRATALGRGPFADPDYDAASVVLLLQAFLGVVTVSAHILAAVTGERRSALARLGAFNAELEAQVAKRTAELRGSEERSRQQLAELEAIYATAPVGLAVIGADCRFLRLNERLAAINGVPVAAHLGRTVREVLPEFGDCFEAIMQRVTATGEPVLNFEAEGETAAQPGVKRAWVEQWLPQKDAASRVTSINFVVEEVTERKAAEAALRRLNETLEQRVTERTAELEAISAERARLASVAENSPDFIGISDLDMGVIYVNPTGRRLVGIESDEELPRRIPLEYFIPEERPRVEREVFPAVLKYGHWVGELTFQHFRTGERIPVLYDVFRIDDPATGEPSHYATVTRDLRERKQAEARLRQAQKMEAVGQLTGGLAHDFNNLLTAVLGNLELLEKKIAGNEAATRLLRSARRAAERGAEVTAQLLAFARKQRLRPKPMDVNKLVTGMGDLLQRTIGATVRIERSLSSHPWPVMVDPNQIELAILNLAINARDAMPLGGTLMIETGNIPAGHPEAPKTLPPGDYVMVLVADTGVGIGEDLLPRVFEPFFTTKEVGKGSGLGLSMVLGIAQQHGGGVEIASQVGRGTTVRLYLPRAVAAAPKEAAKADAPAADVSYPAARCLLVVDDDRDVREFAAECLRDRGYRVIAAENGRAALELVESDEPIDLALVDLVMPGMSGPAFAAAALHHRPSLRVLFMTGYADTGLLSEAPHGTVIKKPFRVSELAARVAEALAEGEVARASNVHPLRPSRL